MPPFTCPAVLGLLVLLFVVVPLVEIWVLLQLTEVVGLAPTVGLVLATGLLGGLVARWQGTEALRDITRALRQGRDPGVELGAAALFVVGAAFLLTPGVLTDAAGFLLMVPRVRRWTARRLASRIRASGNVRVHVGGPAAGGGFGGEGGPGGGPRPDEPKRVDADVTVGDGDDEGDDA